MAAAFSPVQRWLDWLRAAPVTGAVARRNVVMFQCVLIVSGAIALGMAWMSQFQGGSGALTLGMGVGFWVCFALVRAGKFRLAVALVLAAVLGLMGVSCWVYGLRAQSSVQIAHILPLLIGGLLLGRRAIWYVFAALIAILALGAWVDGSQARDMGEAASGAALDWLLSALNFLMATVILDRLIASSEHARRRSEALAVLNRQLEREVQAKEQSQAQLVQSQKLDALGRVASSIVHDLNNVLGVIMGYIGMARDAEGLEGESIDGIEVATRRATAITHRLLGLARDRPRRVEVFDASTAIERALPLLEPLFGRDQEVVLDLPEMPLPVMLDRDEFELTLLNLATNSRDAMNGPGQFRIVARIEGEQVRVAVIDTGCGMSLKLAERAFDVFFTTKPEGKGSGIGLSVVQRVALEAGGKVSLTSAPGAGTTVTIWLPLADGEAA